MLPPSQRPYCRSVRTHLTSFLTRSRPQRTLRPYSSEPATAPTAPTNTTPRYKSGKKKSSDSGTFLKAVLALALVGGGTYGAGAYYALQNPEFRDMFIHRVYAGDVVVKQLEKWRDEKTLERTKDAVISYKNNTVNFGRNAYKSAAELTDKTSNATHDLYEKGKSFTAEITKKTGEFYEKGKSITSDVSKKSHDLYDKSAGVSNASAEKSHQIKETTHATKSAHMKQEGEEMTEPQEKINKSAKNANAAAGSEAAKIVREGKKDVKSAAEELKDKAADSKLVQEVSKAGNDAKEGIQNAVVKATSGIAALLSFSTSSPEPVIAQLSGTLHELDSILGQLPSEKAQKEAHQFLAAAAKEVSDLNSRIAKLKDESKTILEKTVLEQTKKLDAALQQFEQRSREELSKRESHLREDFAIEKAELTLQSSEELKRQLTAQTAKFNAKLQEELTRQATTLERRWLREARIHVDRERGGRLARLDKLESRVVALDRLTTSNTSALQQSAQAHQLRSAVQSLRDVLNESARRPFNTELAAVKSIGQNDSIIIPITETIPGRIPETGVDTLPDLVARFTVVAEEIRKVALVSPGSPGGFIPHILSALFSNLMFRKHGLPEGDDVESILARTEFYLREEELDFATRELSQLEGWSKIIARDWLKAARDRLEFKQAVDLIVLQSNLLSLQMA